MALFASIILHPQTAALLDFLRLPLPLLTVTLLLATISYRFIVPGTENDERPRTAALGFPDTGILRSVRTGRGRKYGDDTLGFLIEILDRAQNAGLTIVEIVINYTRLNVSVTYTTTIEYLRDHGQRVLGESGWELAMPRQLWSVDGAEPEGLAEPTPKPESEATQGALFDFAESVQRKVGAY